MSAFFKSVFGGGSNQEGVSEDFTFLSSKFDLTFHCFEDWLLYLNGCESRGM